MTTIHSWHGQLRVKPAQSLILFICWWILSWVLGSILITRIGIETTMSVRLATVVQDIVMFVLPTLMTMLLIAQRPMRTMNADQAPALSVGLFGIITLVVSIPWMNSLVLWNENLHFPESLSSLEQILRNAENNAEILVNTIIGGTDISDLVISILIIGVLTGISEELFFRGGLQSILVRSTGNIHAAIWLTAFVFSAVHMQFFGFFPRLLMGAFFGYLLYWSNSLWLPVLVHALNNSIVVTLTWLGTRGYSEALLFENFGIDWQWCLASAVLTALSVWRLIRFSNRMKRRYKY
ncbi:CPBP family intramembrane glutamic endopeptidase [uncultured Muribaculum sp.]|uniref:CPBP family intramembrane glutamic endopeptidase n=1 Tax=uncultured Muribaculum sp. TaxID=1918613 RepID=UPI0025B088FB|nr:CPBP family intramembrane glutamic endopeptidase [uncultured Muribaculum sp.]